MSLVFRASAALALAALTVVPAAESATATPSHGGAVHTGQVTLIQGLPDNVVGVQVDGRMVSAHAAKGAVVGPVRLPSGSHEVRFTGLDVGPVVTKVQVRPGADTDVVLHLPAAVNGDPVVNTYTGPTSPIGPGKARVLVAHDATVAPADITMDGKVVFQNVANGEFATADVPAGSHTVAIYPTGKTTHPLLGPITMDLKAGTLTMAYAYGRPQQGSMNVIAHTLSLYSDGSVVPTAIHTGSAGLAGSISVDTFTGGAGSRVPDGDPAALLRTMGLLTAAVAAGVVGARGVRTRRRPGLHRA